jgi:hypothetical protein
MVAEMQELHIHIDEPASHTVGWVTDTILSIEYAYNLAAVVVSVEVGLSGDVIYLTALRQLFSSAPDVGPYTMNLLYEQS